MVILHGLAATHSFLLCIPFCLVVAMNVPLLLVFALSLSSVMLVHFANVLLLMNFKFILLNSPVKPM